MKASINGPNRRKNRSGDKLKASNFTIDTKEAENGGSSSTKPTNTITHSICTTTTNQFKFKVKSLEKLLELHGKQLNNINKESIGDACLFSLLVESNKDEEEINVGEYPKEQSSSSRMWCSGRQVIQQHFQMTESSCNNFTHDLNHGLKVNDPILIHFHDIPILVLRAIPLTIKTQGSDDQNHERNSISTLLNENTIYLSQVHCHNHKICEDTIYTIKCCSRIYQDSNQLSTKNYDNLSVVGIEAFLRYNSNSGHDCNTNLIKEEFQAKEIEKLLINNALHSVLTVNECAVITVHGKDLVCRVSRVCIDRKAISEEGEETYSQSISAADATLEEPFRGRVTINTEFYVQTSNTDALLIHGGRTLREGSFPEDVIHITTSDDEWFPVRRIILAPCIKLTKYVQFGRGKYKNDSRNVLNYDKSRHSPDAPENGIHCRVEIDCCTFDRVLIFIMGLLYPDQYNFALELSEMNTLAHAAQELGLLSLSDLCKSQQSSFASRVRKHKYIRFSEIKNRNENSELLIIIDGMVLDISRWIDEHPGGASIIPSQALNIDCTCFFEMYHVSSASFLYLKSFYIGELHPGTQLEKRDLKPSDGFLQKLRLYTDQWRVKVEEKVDEEIHKSL